MSEQTRREAGEDFRIGRLLQPAFLQVIIVVDTDAQNLRRHGHRRQQPDSVQVDCRRLPEASADAQQVCALCDQLGQSAWKSAVALREAMPARAFIRGNSGDAISFVVIDAHESPAVPRDRSSGPRLPGRLDDTNGQNCNLPRGNSPSRLQASYLNDKDTLARYATTLPSSIFMSSLQTSATRRSRNDLAAVSTAPFAASSQEIGLVPMISVTR